MRKYALLQNNTVIDVVEFEEESYSDYSKNYELVIDVTDFLVIPSVNWILDGNQLIENPLEQLNVIEKEKKRQVLKREFGEQLAQKAVDAIGTQNKLLNKTGTQVSQILSSLLPIKSLLETGALGTARTVTLSIKGYYPEYIDITEDIINQINEFENVYGL